MTGRTGGKRQLRCYTCVCASAHPLTLIHVCLLLYCNDFTCCHICGMLYLYICIDVREIRSFTNTHEIICPHAHTPTQVVRSLLISLAHHETYYSIFNDFIRDNPAVLEDDGFGFMKHCMALLSFENKQAWLKMKLKKLRCGLNREHR